MLWPGPTLSIHPRSTICPVTQYKLNASLLERSQPLCKNKLPFPLKPKSTGEALKLKSRRLPQPGLGTPQPTGQPS